MKSYLEINAIEIYSTHNEGKSVLAERFFRTLKKYRLMTSVLENVYIDSLDDIINKYNTYHRTIKLKPADIKSSTHIDSTQEIYDEDPNFEIGDIVRISKH